MTEETVEEITTAQTSYETFLQHVQWLDTERTRCDSSGVLSRPCYEMWIKTRRGDPSNPEDSFRRTITAHVTGTKKRKPFPPAVERDLLPRLRTKQIWPCFDGCIDAQGREISIGKSGFRAKGYHEQKASSNSKYPEVFSQDRSDEVPFLPDALIVPYQPTDQANRGATRNHGNNAHYLSSKGNHNLLIPEIDEEPVYLDLPPDTICSNSIDAEEVFNLLLESDSFDEFPYFDQAPEHCFKRKLSEKNFGPNEFPEFGETDSYGLPNFSSARKMLRRFSASIRPDDLESYLISLDKSNPDASARMAHCRASWESAREVVLFLLNLFNMDARECFGENLGNIVFDNPPVRIHRLGIDGPLATTRAKLFNIVCNVTTPDVFWRTINAGLGSGHTFMTPAIEADLFKPMEKLLEDPRLDRTFRMRVPVDESFFDPNLLLGESIIDAKSSSYLSCNRAAKQIMRGNLTGYTTASVIRSQVVWWLNYVDVSSAILMSGEIKFQTPSYRIDGSPCVLRIHYKLVGERLYSKFQDVSHLYPHLLMLPALQ